MRSNFAASMAKSIVDAAATWMPGIIKYGIASVIEHLVSRIARIQLVQKFYLCRTCVVGWQLSDCGSCQ